jgi:hypothetical protein
MAGGASYLSYQNAWREVGQRGLRSRLISPDEMAQSNTRFQPPQPPTAPQT